METDGPDELTGLDWRTVAVELLDWAILRGGRYGWNAQSCLPKGSSLQDVVCDVIQEVIENPERLEGVPPMVKMKRMIRTKLWNLAKSKDEDALRVGEMDVYTAPDRGSEASTRAEERARALELLMKHEKVQGSEELQLVLLAHNDGVDKAADVAELLGWPVKKVYECNRVLSTIYPTIARSLRPERGQP